MNFNTPSTSGTIVKLLRKRIESRPGGRMGWVGRICVSLHFNFESEISSLIKTLRHVSRVRA